MFTWYRKSVVCYAYLEDLDTAEVRENPELLCGSRWFTRGWTLQELIAPGIVVFFGSDWREIETRDNLVKEISDATGIDQGLFFNGKLSDFSIAQRMSWAAKRQTTRLEDEAYSLLGLFGVNMPLLYGEGAMAFVRLQEEIMRRSDDDSIFAWATPNTTNCGLLAPSPSCFSSARDVRKSRSRAPQFPFFLTNKGVQITLPILGWTQKDSLPPFELMSSGPGPKIIITPPESLIAVLNCEDKTGRRLALAINRTNVNEPFHRINADLGPYSLLPEDCRKNSEPKKIFVQAYNLVNDFSLWEKLRPTFFGIRGLPRLGSEYRLAFSFGDLTIEPEGMASARLSNGTRVGFVYESTEGHAFGVCIGETDERTGWEIMAGTHQEVEAMAQRFRYKDNKFLTGLRSWSLPIELGGSKKLQVSMVTQKRPHGFSSIIKIDGRSCQTAFTVQAPSTEAELKALLDEAKKAKVENIGLRGPRKAPEILPTRFPRGSLPSIVIT